MCEVPNFHKEMNYEFYSFWLVQVLHILNQLAVRLPKRGRWRPDLEYGWMVSEAKASAAPLQRCQLRRRSPRRPRRPRRTAPTRTPTPTTRTALTAPTRRPPRSNRLLRHVQDPRSRTTRRKKMKKIRPLENRKPGETWWNLGISRNFFISWQTGIDRPHQVTISTLNKFSKLQRVFSASAGIVHPATL